MKKKIELLRVKYFAPYAVIAAVTLVFAILTLAGVMKVSDAYKLEAIAISIILALSLSLVVGFLGELSLGHAGFMCVGAYLGGKVASLLVAPLGNGILTLLIALAVGGICAGVCGFIIGLPALRLKGDYLAITTLAFGEIVRTIFQYVAPSFFGGTMGLPTPRFDKKWFFVICLIMVMVTLAVIQNLIRSKHGRAITAIRDNEIAARATGINVTRYKLTAFIVAAVFAGFAGVLFSYTQNNISAPTFDYNYSIEILVMVVLGGMGSINGSILAATAVTFLNKELSTLLTGNLAVLKDLVYALILIVIVIYNNSPKLAAFREKYNFRNLLDRITRGRHAKKDRDDAGRWDVVPTKIEMDALLSTDFVVNEIKADKPKEDKK